MFKNLNETVLKVIIIAAILIMFCILYVTGIAFVLGHYETSNLLMHKLAALLILGLLAGHAWLRRCTIRRLMDEFIAILTNRHIRHEDNIDFLIHNTKNQSFQELCSWFHFDTAFMQQKLFENHVKIDNTDDTLKKIAKYNDKDMYQVLLLMIKLHVEKNNPEPLPVGSCYSGVK